MDSRRPKGVHDPIVRQVGFVTPGSEPQQPVGLQQVVDSVSPTPVIIPPPQPSSRSASDSSRHFLPVSVPAPSQRPATIPEADEPEESPQAHASAMTSSPASASNKGYNSRSTDSLLGTSPVPALAPIAAAATGKAGGLPAGGAEKPFRAAPSGAGLALTLEPAPGGPLPSGNAPLSPRPPLVPASAPPGTSGLAPAELPRVNTRPPLQGPAVRSPIRSPASSGPATPTSQGGGGRGTQAAPSVVASVPGTDSDFGSPASLLPIGRILIAHSGVTVPSTLYCQAPLLTLVPLPSPPLVLPGLLDPLLGGVLLLSCLASVLLGASVLLLSCPVGADWLPGDLPSGCSPRKCSSQSRLCYVPTRLCAEAKLPIAGMAWIWNRETAGAVIR